MLSMTVLPRCVVGYWRDGV